MAQLYHDPPHDGAAHGIPQTAYDTVKLLSETPEQQLFSASLQLALDVETTYEESIAYSSLYTKTHDDVMIWITRPARFGSQHPFGYDYIYQERLRTAESLEPEPLNSDYIDSPRGWYPENPLPYEHSDMGNAQARFSGDLYELAEAQELLDEGLCDRIIQSRKTGLHVAAMEHAVRMDGIMVLREKLVHWQKQGGGYAAREMRLPNEGRPVIAESYLRFLSTLGLPLEF